MLSVVANAALDGIDEAALSDLELYLFFNLLFSAGAETTRNAIAGGLLALAEYPEQYQRLRDDPSLLPSAVEEMVRWTSPSPSKRRTATRETVLGGCAVRAATSCCEGRPTATRRCSPTRPCSTLAASRIAQRALVRVHYCLGANLARIEPGLV